MLLVMVRTAKRASAARSKDTTSTRGSRRELERYRAKRDFAKTPEPEGSEPSADGQRRFVVQRHRARRLHYDLRFEIDGVLVSWAVPKGPTLDPTSRRLAVHVEDHPIEYLDFEGVIPEGEYGGGDVIVWDRGTWSPHETDDPAAAVAGGELHADVQGEKLAGRFVLVRRGDDASGKEQWLLLHKRDEYAVSGWDPEDFPRSVKSGRTNDEVAEAPDALWRSDAPAAEAELKLPRGSRKAGKSASSKKSASPKKNATPKRRRARPRPEWSAPTADELAALDALDRKGTWELQGRSLALTNLDKVLFPARKGVPKATKRDLIRYYACIAPAMLPYLADRPVNLHRFPDGVDRPGFWHKAVPSHTPEWIRRWRYGAADPGETEWYIVPDSVAALAWLANYGAIELHPWTSRIPRVDRPTYAMIDIDPGPASSFDDVVLLARLFRTALDHLGLVGRAKLTGQRGMQIWVPITPGPSFEETRGWFEALSRAVGQTVPDLVSWAWHKDDRKGRARLDYTQNAVNKTLVVPYGVRAAPGAPVSAPIEWDELDDPELRADRWTMGDILDRVAEIGDLFAPVLEVEQHLPKL
jgi:bifunctional non-homologous end joining protein LigD